MSISRMRTVSPISNGEFLQMFQRSTPPVGWHQKIAIANSGGSDSTCLLFLVNRLLSDRPTNSKGLPKSVVSLTVDHGLQASSSSMAKHCSKYASSLDVKHLTIPIPWSEPPFPPRPSDGEAIENIARDARFYVLFNAMTRMGVKTLAFGHHADDQVETSLMRLARGTTEIGAGGMRPCRRWGMGLGRSVEDKLGWAGYEGMHRWIVRPLLEVSKDRVLATCDENGLEYVTDGTNFQPEVTLRNAIRQMLKNEEAYGSGETPENESQMDSLPADIKKQLDKMREATTHLRSVHYDISGGTEQLRGAVKVLSSRVADINEEVDRHLKQRTVPSPIGTFLLSSYNLSAIRDNAVRSAMIMRIMRYVSFQPWGSVRADGNRRVGSIRRIVDTIWAPDPHYADMRHFVAGSGVLWRPVAIYSLPSGKHLIRIPGKKIANVKVRGNDRFGWLASRQPPFHKNVRAMGDASDPLTFDLTDRLCRARQELQEGIQKRTQDDQTAVGMLEILYDCRFIIRFDVARMPVQIGLSLSVGRSQIVVEHRTRWYWPQVTWRRPGHDDHLAVIVDESQVSTEAPLVNSDLSSWINIEWIRTLDAT